jgi:hypothetical protein
VGLWRIAALTFALALSAAPACAQAADGVLDMAPVEGWVLDYAEDSCALRRGFSGGGHQVALELRQTSPLDGFQVTIVSNTMTRNQRGPRVHFEPERRWFEPNFPLLFDDGTRYGVSYSDNLRPVPAVITDEEPPPWSDAERNAREREVTGLVVTRTFEPEFRLLTGPMHAPMEAMRTCLDELLTHWGLDAAAQRTLTRKAAAIQDDWNQQLERKLPRDLTRSRQDGILFMRFIVGIDGRPSACSAKVQTAADPPFEQAVCEVLMSVARFRPALDAQGSPIASYYASQLLYSDD